jgi:hypothetical protein
MLLCIILVQLILKNASNMNLTRVYVWFKTYNVILMADKKNPHIGIIVKMSSGSLKHNCSLAVSVLCDLNGVQVRFSLFPFLPYF